MEQYLFYGTTINEHNINSLPMAAKRGGSWFVHFCDFFGIISWFISVIMISDTEWILGPLKEDMEIIVSVTGFA